jgi:hypothetical protein
MNCRLLAFISQLSNQFPAETPSFTLMTPSSPARPISTASTSSHPHSIPSSCTVPLTQSNASDREASTCLTAVKLWRASRRRAPPAGAGHAVRVPALRPLMPDATARDSRRIVETPFVLFHGWRRGWNGEVGGRGWAGEPRECFFCGFRGAPRKRDVEVVDAGARRWQKA